MPFSDYFLYRLAKNWPSPMARQTARLGAEPGTDAHHAAYAQDEFDRRVKYGIQVAVTDLDVLEIGCGHGGISCFLAAAGARSVVGIDLNLEHLEYARRFAERIAARMGQSARLPVTFVEMNAYEMTFDEGSFDLVVAENSFEHFMQPETVMQQARRVLREKGRLLVPNFSSIYSKYGLHLKNGLKLPWANLFFSEKAIVRAMQRMAAADPKLVEIYPGLNDRPQTVRDLRRYKDLNDITFKRFKQLADRSGFDLEWFRPFSTRMGHITRRLPLARTSLLMDIFSTGASACLKKRG